MELGPGLAKKRSGQLVPASLGDMIQVAAGSVCAFWNHRLLQKGTATV